MNVLNLLSDSVSVQRSLYRRMIRDPTTRALNQMWAEEREDGDEEKESLPHVVPSIGESMAVRLLRAKASN